MHYALNELELIDDNPCLGIDAPKDSRPPRKDPEPYLRADEIEKLTDSINVPFEYKVIFLTAIYTGLRAGEMWGLKWDDVAFDRCELIVRHSYRNAPKGGNHRLDRVPLLDIAYSLLKTWQSHPVRLGYRPSPLVFATRSGNMRHPGDDAGWADKLDAGVLTRGYRYKAGIERSVTFHQLRATCGTHLVSGTWGRHWSLIEVQQFLRHVSFATTQKHYARFLPGALQDAARATKLSPRLPPELPPR